MKDLLQKDHEDRVKDYLKKMDGMSIDEIVSAKNTGKEDSPKGNSKQITIVDAMRKQSNAMDRTTGKSSEML